MTIAVSFVKYLQKLIRESMNVRRQALGCVPLAMTVALAVDSKVHIVHLIVVVVVALDHHHHNRHHMMMKHHLGYLDSKNEDAHKTFIVQLTVLADVALGSHHHDHHHVHGHLRNEDIVHNYPHMVVPNNIEGDHHSSCCKIWKFK